MRFLAAGAEPVRRLPRPGLRAAGFLVFALTVAIAGGLHLGTTDAIGLHLAQPLRLAQWILGVLTGAVAIFAAFHLSVPGTRDAWALAPLPCAMVWVAAYGVGCATEYRDRGSDAFAFWVSWPCVEAMLVYSIPMGIGLGTLVHSASETRPGITIVTGALGVAAFASTSLSLYHDLDTSFMILLWHIGTTIAIIALAHAAASGIYAVSRMVRTSGR